MVQTGPIPLVAPRPGYATNISALTLNYPSPAATPVRGHGDMFDRGSPAITVPKTPHPLQPPITPIAPVFARPKKTLSVKFAPDQPIMRGEKEETLLPTRGERGDQFWRRFSMVAKVENNRPRFVPLARYFFDSNAFLHTISAPGWPRRTLARAVSAVGYGSGPYFWFRYESRIIQQVVAVVHSLSRQSSELPSWAGI